MPRPRDLGILGEEAAARYLRGIGYRILARNFRFGRREVDLIVARDDIVAFVEVKARAGLGYGHPLDAITPIKRREIERVARRWQQQHGRPGLNYRFDAVSVVLGRAGQPIVEHLPNAWQLGT